MRACQVVLSQALSSSPLHATVTTFAEQYAMTSIPSTVNCFSRVDATEDCDCYSVDARAWNLIDNALGLVVYGRSGHTHTLNVYIPSSSPMLPPTDSYGHVATLPSGSVPSVSYYCSINNLSRVVGTVAIEQGTGRIMFKRCPDVTTFTGFCSMAWNA